MVAVQDVATPSEVLEHLLILIKELQSTVRNVGVVVGCIEGFDVGCLDGRLDG